MPMLCIMLPVPSDYLITKIVRPPKLHIAVLGGVSTNYCSLLWDG